MAADKGRKDKADVDFQKKQTEIVKQGKQDLSDSEKQTAEARAEIDKQAALNASPVGPAFRQKMLELFDKNHDGRLDDDERVGRWLRSAARGR